jgi:hypothetical protein
VWWDALSKDQMSQHREWRIWDPPKIINIPFDLHCICSIHLIYLKYSGVLFFNGYFQSTVFLNPSNAPSLTLLISLSLSLSAYSSLCFHLLPFDINTLMILLTVSLNKLDWMNTVFHLQFAHNICLWIEQEKYKDYN